MANQLGNIYWVSLTNRIPHPYVVIEINSNLIKLCRITTNQKKANLPGNVLLEIGEGNLEKQSIVDVADVIEVNKSQFSEYIGKLSDKRVNEIITGIKFLEKTYFGK
jgi:mRNA interferase MazF